MGPNSSDYKVPLYLYGVLQTTHNTCVFEHHLGTVDLLSEVQPIVKQTLIVRLPQTERHTATDLRDA